MNITKLDYSEQDTCPICKNKFASLSNLNKHIKNIHKEKRIVSKRLVSYPSEKYDNKCLEGCNISFASRMCLIDHLNLIHEMEITEEKLKFTNIEEFESWLETEQEETNAQYIRGSGWKKKPNRTVMYMNCNRSGKYHVKEENRKRKIKLNGEGSCKTGNSCTSHLIVEVLNKTNQCQVSYFKQHYGHVLDQKHLRISKSARQKVTEKLLLGASFPRVLDSLKSESDGSADVTNKITRKDLHNIKRSMKIDVLYGKRHEDDGKSIEKWVEECKNDHDNPVLYYKKRGDEHSDDYGLKEEDFCLIFMNTTQATLLKTYGKNLVCIDVVRGGIGFIYELTTVLITDDNNRTFPVSFMIANRNDVLIYEIFFKNIQKITENISPKILMTDIYHRSFDAWNNIMGLADRHLYSSWQVDYDWKSHIDKIWARELHENKTKRKEVYKKLKILHGTSEEDEFNELYDAFVSATGQDVCLKKFYSYFIDTYSRTKLWATCYRTDLSADVDESLRCMSKLLEHEFLEGRNVKRLDMAVHCLLNFTNDLLAENLGGICTESGLVETNCLELKIEHDIAQKFF